MLRAQPLLLHHVYSDYEVWSRCAVLQNLEIEVKFFFIEGVHNSLESEKLLDNGTELL